MATMRNKIAKLAGYHHNIVLAACCVEEYLKSDRLIESQEKRSSKDFKKTIEYLQNIRNFIQDADKTVESIAPLIYEKVGRDTEIA